MEEEIWKPVEELPEKYLVSNLGRIKYIGGYRGVADRIIQSCDKNGKGYYRVNMWDSKNKKNIPRSVHFLVARAFVDNPNHYTVINHKDETLQIIERIILNGVLINIITNTGLLEKEHLKLDRRREYLKKYLCIIKMEIQLILLILFLLLLNTTKYILQILAHAVTVKVRIKHKKV